MRRAPIAFIVCAICIASLILTGCDASAEDSGGADMTAYEASVSKLCAASGVDRSEAERIISILSGTGLTGNIEYVTEWNMNGGDSYYRVRNRDGDKRELYISDGKLFRVTDGKTVYYDEGQTVSTGHIMETGENTPPGTDTPAVTGPFAGCGTETDADGTAKIEIILNTSSKKYHYPGCRAIDSMAEANKKTVYVSDVSELLEMGYSPCGICAKGDRHN